ncbi:MAG: GntR family transcriptional regulator, partial [Gemmatimonadetes bacterium]|nr:GntR family transcriptional regulator [Gemmatimonadota bacterium]
MFDALDPRSPTPLYEQIAGRIRLAVASGELVEGDALPSVRGLATELRVNPATVVKAYRDLEVMGLLNTRRGMGVYIQKGVTARCRAECAKRIAERLHEVVHE